MRGEIVVRGLAFVAIMMMAISLFASPVSSPVRGYSPGFSGSVADSDSYAWDSGTSLSRASDGAIKILNDAGTVGAILDASSSGVLKITTQAGGNNFEDLQVGTIQLRDGGTGYGALLSSGFILYANLGLHIALSDTSHLLWSSTSSGQGTADVGIKRDGANVLASTDGSTGEGAFRSGKYTSDPCGTLTEGSIFYNDTSDYYCFCSGAGADLQIHSPATACF